MGRITIPEQVRQVLLRITQAGFSAYAVGGCVRDSILGTQPNDWDICTSARPEETAALFSHTVLTGAKYGTVTVIENGISYEVTTFRAENGYSDHRHPEKIEFLSDLGGDLSRRDFSVNAMAADTDGNVIDLFDGLHDLRHGLIRCVGEPEERFTEDALRILRALRFASRLDFSIEPRTARAIHALAPSLKNVANERIAKELHLLCGKGAAEILREFSDVFTVFIPELADCIGFQQYNFHHKYDVWEHTLHALEAEKTGNFTLRLAILLHDIGKPSCFSMDKNLRGHFYGHASVGGFMAEKILRRLRFDNATVKAVAELVALHDYPLYEMTERSVRRFVAKHGKEKLRMLIALRCADLKGKGSPNKVEDFAAQIEEKLTAEVVTPLQLKGADLIAIGMREGREIGRILHLAQEAVFDGAVENDHSALCAFAQNLIDKHRPN